MPPPSNDHQPGAPGLPVAAAINYAIGALQRADDGFPRGMAAALVLFAGYDGPAPVPMATLVFGPARDVVGVTLQPIAGTRGHDDRAPCATARQSIEDGWADAHAAGVWGPRDILVQAGPHGGTIVPVCSPTANDYEHQRRQFIQGVLAGLDLLRVASQ